MNKQLIICFLIAAIFVSYIEAQNGTVTCELKSQVDTKIFDPSNYVSDLVVLEDGWFVATTGNQYKVHLVNYRKNKTLVYDTNITMGNFSQPFYPQLAIYLPDTDVLVIGGNGLYAISNATQNENTTNPQVRILMTPSYLSCYGLQRFSKDSFVIMFVDPMRYMATGRMMTYNTTTWSRYSDINLNNFPQMFTVLTTDELVYNYYIGLNEQRIQLPNLTILQTITLDSSLQSNLFDMIRNNDTSFYVVTNFDGIELFYQNSSAPSFQFGKNLTIAGLTSINHRNAFMTNNNFTQVAGYQYFKGPGGFTFDQVGSINVTAQNEKPNILSFATGDFDPYTNTFVVDFIAGYKGFYRSYQCIYLETPNNSTLIE